MTKITGLTQFEKTYIGYVYENNRIIQKKLEDKKSNIDFLLDPNFPTWLVRHSFGVNMGEEDLSNAPIETFLDDNRSKNFGYQQRSGSVRDLFYNGLRIQVQEHEYAHAVGPIHAGIIEPGHFRFLVENDHIKILMIRLGFLNRQIQNLLIGKNPEKGTTIAETISGDSTVAYALAFSKCYEESVGFKVHPSVSLFRSILVELERISVHIGDLAGISEDMGYYPLYGVCATERGAGLALMETWTGSRFGKGVMRPGGIRINSRTTLEKAKSAFYVLKDTYEKKILPQFHRAASNSTIKERMQGLGVITKEQVSKYGFLGMVSRMAGVSEDLRIEDPNYPSWEPLDFRSNQHNLCGDVWSRFYLRMLEISQSMSWLEQMLGHLDWSYLWSKEQFSNTIKLSKMKSNENSIAHSIHYASVEGWRGPILVSLEFNEDLSIKSAYIRDPSVLNWHALELAVRGVAVSDFPLNNKSFNLSYGGFDL